MRGANNRGVYAVFWEMDDDGSRCIVPSTKDTPEDIKLMILDSLLTDLKIPIEINKHRLKGGR